MTKSILGPWKESYHFLYIYPAVAPPPFVIQSLASFLGIVFVTCPFLSGSVRVVLCQEGFLLMAGKMDDRGCEIHPLKKAATKLHGMACFRAPTCLLLERSSLLSATLFVICLSSVHTHSSCQTNWLTNYPAPPSPSFSLSFFFALCRSFSHSQHPPSRVFFPHKPYRFI